jgi:outer membrane receptor for ferrienterochelin and colicins
MAMKRTLILNLAIIISVNSFSQTDVTLIGKVVDKYAETAISGATVTIRGSNVTTVTDEGGFYRFPGLKAGNIVLLISHIGYETLEISSKISDSTEIINAALVPDFKVGDDIVISASKQPEKVTKAPASILLINTKDLAQFAGSNVSELVAKLQGVEYTRSGVDEITFNARGLNNAFNIKVMQLVDGRNSITALSGGLAVFNNGSTNKEDIDHVEIILGPQSALYGPNAHNVLFNYITKDPRMYQGTTAAISAGSQRQFSSRIRHAQKINDKWAYKLTGEYATGSDYAWYDTVYAGNQPPGIMPFYGQPVSIPERISDFTFRRYRGEAHVYYNITPNTNVIVSTGGSNFTRLQVTPTGRNQLKEASYSFLQAKLVHPRFFVNVYNTWGDLGNTLLITNYTRDYWNSTHDRRGSLSPDSAETYATRLGNTVIEKSQRLNAELQYNYKFENAGLFLVAGLSYQKEKPYAYGIGLIDSFQRITITQSGAVLQIDKALPWDLRFIGAARFDYHSNFGNFLSPRFALVKAVPEGSFRITFGRAYSMPSISNQYAGINRLLFGNGKGIYYIPNGVNVKDIQLYRTTTPLEPEEVNTWEVGYKGRITKKLFIDINIYNGISKSFISPPITVTGRVLNVGGVDITHNPAFAGAVINDTLRNAMFLTYFNYGDVRTYGLDLGFNYIFNQFFNAGIKYSWFGSDITNYNSKNDANEDNYVSPEERSLNAPVNRGSLQLNFQNLFKGKLFAVAAIRYVQQYDFYSGNQIGTQDGKGKRGVIIRPDQPPLLKNFDWGPLGGFTSVDINTGYQFNQMISVNLGITNLFNTRQIEFVGSPSIGRLIMGELKMHVPAGKKKAN